ncbi:MAG: hypothetical protein ACLFR0_07380 [Alphaproteobacteria bacterium]
MKKLLAFTSVAVLSAGVAHAKVDNYNYGPDMYTADDRYERLFDELDLDNDGVVRPNEYNAAQSVRAREIPLGFFAMDLDNNGVITRGEAEELAMQAEPADVRERYDMRRKMREERRNQQAYRNPNKQKDKTYDNSYRMNR